MYAKIETGSLIFTQLNQTKLRSEEKVSLLDSFVNDVNTTKIGRLTILISSFTGNSVHMHEFA